MALPKKHSCSSDRALEMRMRDALDGLEELACISASESTRQMTPEGLEILSIEPPPETDPVHNATRATIHNLPLRHTQEEDADIARWLIQREQNVH